MTAKDVRTTLRNSNYNPAGVVTQEIFEMEKTIFLSKNVEYVYTFTLSCSNVLTLVCC